MNKSIKLVAETAWHHEGDFDFMKALVLDIIHHTKADFIKYHLTVDLDEYIDERYSVYRTLKKWALDVEMWTELIEMTRNGGKEIMLLLNDTKAIDFGLKFNPKLIEIHSVCLNDIHLLEHLRGNLEQDQQVVLGVGGSDLYEIESAIETIQHENVILMFGFQNYPTNYNNINLRKIKKIKELYPEYEFGYADHTAWDDDNNILITALVAATGVGYIEKHLTNNYGKKRCDWESAISIEMFNKLSSYLEILSAIEGDGTLKLNPGEKKYSIYGPMKKAALLRNDVKKGEILTKENIIFKRTEQVSDMSQLDIQNNFGKIFQSDLPKGEVLFKNHLEKLSQ